jgi:hypothetical protein
LPFFTSFALTSFATLTQPIGLRLLNTGNAAGNIKGAEEILLPICGPHFRLYYCVKNLSAINNTPFFIFRGQWAPGEVTKRSAGVQRTTIFAIPMRTVAWNPFSRTYRPVGSKATVPQLPSRDA